MLNTAATSIPPHSTNELYAQLLFVALERLGLDAHTYLEEPERARAASDALAVLWLAIELGASADEPSRLEAPRFERTLRAPSLAQLAPLARGLEAGAREQLAALNSSGLLEVPPEQWQAVLPPRGTDVMSTLALAWLAEAAVLGDELVVWLADATVLRRVVDALAVLLEQTLSADPTLKLSHVPLSRSAIGEGERSALIDVFRAEHNPSLASQVVSKSDRHEPAASVAVASRRQRLVAFAVVALSALSFIALWLLLRS